ncbi:hypothetical protein P691DRAFT_670489 [Macrolepiota fuliginosa MF-IS2]|uniref:P-loop containing nucleoside triphosphate hydrolase protein n=1 Tax=Macrolepiota fuliginosa MF-IS2 TaxID=1400762 RepID=A0A9P5XBD8_9AGAR|nr:hypothetical protein P691DRAFT_670489 [Macrolepiota fuliginosa MF-IS2]
MPSYPAATALIHLFLIDGAPWNWPIWQDLTGIHHGLFPDDDKELPPGWTRQHANDAQTYIYECGQLATTDKREKFLAGSKGDAQHPGRVTWNNFVSRNWKRWGIHNLVVEELKAWDVHPMAIIAREGDVNASWPPAEFFLLKIVDTLGMKLFGEAAFPAGSETLRTDVRRCVLMVAQRSWNTIRLQVASLRSRPNEIEATAIAAFADLELGKPTKAKVNHAIRAVAKWKECAELFHTDENIKKAGEMLIELQVIMEGLGAKISKKETARGSRVCKVSAKALKNLASEEDVTDLLGVYHEYFEANVEDADEELTSDPLPNSKQLIDGDGDFGMEEEAGMKFAKLCTALEFRNGLPVQFNVHRHSSGLSPWDHDDLFTTGDGHPLLRLHWHQLAGAHSIIRSTFTEEKNPGHTVGVLIGDEVGLGKTAQAITFIAFLNQVIYLQKTGGRLPPILMKRRYLFGRNRVPSLPHLIVCPGTLTGQWVSELKILFKPKMVDILVYDSQTDSDQFWGPDGPLSSTNHDIHNCIVVATHSALFNDMKRTHKVPTRGKNTRPWDIPELKTSLANTIFGRDFLTITIDEAHHMRNTGNKHTAALRLLQQAKVRLIMTATPLHTAPKDIASLARLVGLPHFFDEASFIEEKDDMASLRRAKKFDDDGEASLSIQQKIAKRLQVHCKGHFLRRTPQSRDCNGRALVPLPPYRTILGALNLTERETAIIRGRAEAAKAAVVSSSDSRIQTKKFYLEYRTAVGYAKEDPSDPWPSFESLKEWELVKSTKMDSCARVCLHYLSRDDVEDVAFEDGKPIFPEAPTVPGEQRMRRIIIFAEFPSMTPLLQNVLRLYGIKSLAISGKIPFSERDKRVKALYDDTNPARVLIFSSVGSAGLNLSISDVVIFFDQPWSAQDERQIIGRAHRQPQEKTVKVIYLLANGSSDPLMNTVARGKGDAFKAFVNKDFAEGSCFSFLDNSAQGLTAFLVDFESILQGRIPDIDDRDIPAEKDGSSTKDGGKTRPKRGKPRPKPTATEDNDTDSKWNVFITCRMLIYLSRKPLFATRDGDDIRCSSNHNRKQRQEVFEQKGQAQGGKKSPTPC